MWAANLVAVLTDAGQVSEARRMASEARSLLGRIDRLGLLGATMAMEATLLAVVDEVDSASGLLDAIGPGEGDLRLQVLHGRARSWIAAAQGRVGEAAEIAAETAALAEGAAARLHATILAHDAARFGWVGAVALLDDLEAHMEGDLVTMCAAHARALDAEDPDALDAASATFEAHGAQLWAAESAALAGRWHRQLGDRRPAGRSTARAVLLSEAFPDVRTPALTPATELLTPREREVALLAGRRLSSLAIGAELGISRKTVDNHLGAVYQKIGVTSRAELAEALGNPGD